MSEPAYLKLYKSGELKERVKHAFQFLEKCKVCPRHCGVNRLKEEHGFCRTGSLPHIAHTVAHFGEEPVLTGSKGSGNVFFASCNLKCSFCQNYQISQENTLFDEYEMSYEELARQIINLQDQGCHVLNFVSPSHFVPQMIKVIEVACNQGLKLPIVYNSNGYDDLESLKLLDGIIDIYLPDFKYYDDKNALNYSKAPHYSEKAKLALKEMFRQVGHLEIDSSGIAQKGLIVRHLVLPNELSDSEFCLQWLREEFGPELYLSLMSQYYPTNKALDIPLLSRKLRHREYERILELLDELGFENGFTQALSSQDYYQPDFDRELVFER